MFNKRLLVAILLAGLFSIKSFAQFTATWAFTANNTGVKAGVQQTDVAIADASIGIAFPSPGYSTNGVKCQPTVEWITAPTNDWHIDFPISPNGSVDITLSGLQFIGRTSGSSGNNIVSLAYQKDGAGAFIPFGTTQIVPSGGTNTITLPAFSKKFFSGHTYTIRMYIYAVGTGTSNSRSVSVKTLVFNGISSVAGTQPNVTTATAIATGKYTGLVTGIVTSGTLQVQQSGVCWSTTANPTANLATVTTNGPAFPALAISTSGNINAGNGGSITGLTAGTAYNARAYCISESLDTFYGANLSFTTDPATIPSLTTNPATSITSIKATSGGVILDSGGVGITSKGVCWNTSSTPTTANFKTVDGAGNASFTSTLKILTPNTKYYIRAYATNSVGTGYGNLDSFTTIAPEPVIITTTPTTTLTGGSYIPFGSVIVNNISAIKSYTLTASALLPAAGNILITAPAGFEISLNTGAGFSSSISLPYTGGAIATTTIYVRFLPTQFGDYSGTITHTGGGATVINIDDVTVTGKGIQNPGDFSNVGTDFWVGYGFQALMTGSNNQEMVLYMSSAQNAVVTVEIGKPGDPNYYIQTYNITANTAAVSFSLPKNGAQDARLNSTGILPRGIHVYSNGVPFALWAHIYASQSSGATLVLPTNTWGSNYSVLTVGGKTNTGVPHSFFFVQAAEDNTVVDITPAADITATASGTTVLYPAGVPFSVTLNKGDVFNALGTLITSSIGNDLTGTTVVSQDCNKKIALFTGNGRVQLSVGGCSFTDGGSDNFLQQMFPKQAWGTKYLTSPFRNMEAGFYKVIVGDPTTQVTVNGVLQTTLVQNAYTIETDTLLNIVSDKPVMVAQFCATHKCSGTGIPTNPITGNIGDPEMIILSPVQQAINDVTVYSTNSYAIQHNYINVIIKNSGVSSFMLDGVNVASAFSTHTADNNYSYAAFVDVTGNTSHRLQSNEPFTAIAYGFTNDNNHESYGYNAGTNLKAINKYLSVANTYPNLTNDSVIAACLNNDFKFKVTIPYKPTSMKWDFFNNAALQPNNDTVLVTAPLPIDSVIVNGIKLFTYQLPTTYHFTTIGLIPVNITVDAIDPDGCSGKQTITLAVKVTAPPKAYFINKGITVCPLGPILLNDSSYGSGAGIHAWNWTFPGGNPATATIQNPTVSFPGGAGTYNISLRVIDSIGCFKDTTETLTIDPNPVVNSITSTNSGYDCAGKSISFTANTTSVSPIVKWYWDFGDGTKDTTNTNASSHTYANTGTYTVSVIVKNANGCLSVVQTLVQNIYKIKADMNFTSPHCEGDNVSFTNASTGSVSAPPISTNWAWSFGDPGNNTATSQNTSFTYNTAGNYNVKLKMSLMQVGVGAVCEDSITKPIVILAKPQITNVTANNTNGHDCVGKSITFTATTTNLPAGAVKWYWNFDDGKTDSSTTNQINHTYTTAGTYTVSVYAEPAVGCRSNTLTLLQTIHLVKADFTFTTPQCINDNVLFTDNSTGKITSALIDTRLNWSFGDAANSTATIFNPVVTTTFAYTAAGTFNVKLKTSLMMGGNAFCEDSITKPITILPILSKPVVTVLSSATTSTSLTFNWAAITGATGYQVSTNNGASWTTPSSGATGLSHVLTSLTANTAYGLCVKALGSCPGDSACTSGKTLAQTSAIYIPTAFTPNGAGANDKMVVCASNLKSVQFMVFNQWGEKIFETTSTTANALGCYETWDGKHKGVMQPVGVYVYVSVITDNNGVVTTKKGIFSLIR